jgi:hypothetical protein
MYMSTSSTLVEMSLFRVVYYISLVLNPTGSLITLRPVEACQCVNLTIELVFILRLDSYHLTNTLFQCYSFVR